MPDDFLKHLSDTCSHLATRQTINPGEVLFYEGDPPTALIQVLSGQIALTWAGQPRGLALPGSLLDPAAVLGGLPHTVKATVTQPGEVMRWPLADLAAAPDFADRARRYLGEQLRDVQARLAEVTAPIHYTGAYGAEVIPGPFLFKDVELLIAFCEADLSAVESLLPPGLALLRLPGRTRAPLFIGLARFPDAHPEANPEARFAYTETTIFIPVWYDNTPGVFIPYIYPSTWEPILIGREVYGFPKRSGETRFDPGAVSLTVDGVPHLSLAWQAQEGSDETALVGALMAWLGIERHAAAAAFQMGEALRRLVVRGPAHRRVDVFLCKRIPAADSTPDSPRYAVDQLTHAVFGVLRWFQVSKLREPVLCVTGGPLAAADVTLREAYRTILDMRLSAGEVLRDTLTEG